MSDEESLISALLANAPRIAAQAQAVMGPITNIRENVRSDLLAHGKILSIPEQAPEKPLTMCAIDGGRVKESLYAADLVAVVATTGEARYQQCPQPLISDSWAHLYPHQSDVDRIAGTAMAALELSVAVRAPHSVRLLDGSFLTPIVEFRKGLTSRNTMVRNEVAALMSQYGVAANLRELLTPCEGRRIVLALPKSETGTTWRDSLNRDYGVSLTTPDRIVATQILRQGEVLVPRPLTEWSNQRIPVDRDAARPVREMAEEINDVIEQTAQRVEEQELVTTYLRPVHSDGVIRLEYLQPREGSDRFTEAVAALVQAETPTPHTVEPFAQWAADKHAKTVSSGIRALKTAALRHLTESERTRWGNLFNMNYRT